MTGRMATILLLMLATGFAITAHAVRAQSDATARHRVTLRAVAESIGMPSMALSRDDAATRHPTEGCCSCSGNTPCGYCLYGACDIVTCPGCSCQPLKLEVVRAAR
jgi:hypothetical protein